MGQAKTTLLSVTDSSYASLVASQKGNVLLVDFWATYCAPCREELPHLVQLQREHDKDGLRLIIVSIDDPEQEQAAAKFLDSIGAPPLRYIKRTKDTEAFINAVDSTWSGGLPGLFLYKRTGKRLRRFANDVEFPEITAAVTRLLTAPAPTVQ